MKRLIFYFLLFPFLSSGQEMGTIEVDQNTSATLMFNYDIDFVIFGNNPQVDEGIYRNYDFFTDDNVCVIRGSRLDAPETSITVKLSDKSVWFGKVKIGANSLILYDFSTKKLVASSNNSNSHSKKNPVVNSNSDTPGTSSPVKKTDQFITSDNMNVINNIEMVKNLEREFFTLGNMIGDVIFSINTIRNDNHFMYIQLGINNKSGNSYLIDGILFKFIEGRRKGLRRNEVKSEERIMPVSIDGVGLVKGYTNELFVVAIPLFAINNSGKLDVTIREKNGTRNVVMSIRGNVLNKIKNL